MTSPKGAVMPDASRITADWPTASTEIRGRAPPVTTRICDSRIVAAGDCVFDPDPPGQVPSGRHGIDADHPGSREPEELGGQVTHHPESENSHPVMHLNGTRLEGGYGDTGHPRGGGNVRIHRVGNLRHHRGIARRSLNVVRDMRTQRVDARALGEAFDLSAAGNHPAGVRVARNLRVGVPSARLVDRRIDARVIRQFRTRADERRLGLD